MEWLSRDGLLCLADATQYECEGGKSSDAAALKRLQSFIDAGQLRLLPQQLPALPRPALLSDTAGCVSVVVTERVQGDRRRAPVAARTLLLDAARSRIIMRGINKFPSLEELGRLPSPLVRPHHQQAPSHTWLQRKLGGFIVHLFALEPCSLLLMSKHALRGPHVDLATRVLHSTTAPEQRAALARALFEEALVLSGECISLAADATHPVAEAAHDNQLWWFSLHARASFKELAVPFHVARERIVSWGLSAVPARQLNGDDAAAHARFLRDEVLAMRSWGHENICGGGPSEGYVLLQERAAASEFVACTRLKLKTARYRALRGTRSVILGESARHSPCPEFFLRHCFLQWMLQVACGGRGGLEAVQEKLRLVGIARLFALFERFAASSGAMAGQQQQQQQQNAPVVGEISEARGGKSARVELTPIGALTDTVERYLDAAEGGGQEGRMPRVTLLVMSGLPGVGKTTVRHGLITALHDAPGAVGHVIVVDRDGIAAQHAEGQQPGSNHRARQLRKEVHTACCRAFALALQVSLSAPGALPVLLVVDACNAEVAARRLWFDGAPAEVRRLCCYVRTSDPAVACARACARRDHPTLPPGEVDVVQAAVFAVAKKFQAPSAALDGCPVVTLDTSSLSVEQGVGILAAALFPGFATRSAPHGSPPVVLSSPVATGDWLTRECDHQLAVLGLWPAATPTEELLAAARGAHRRGRWICWVVGPSPPQAAVAWDPVRLAGECAAAIAQCLLERRAPHVRIVAGTAKWIDGQLLRNRELPRDSTPDGAGDGWLRGTARAAGVLCARGMRKLSGDASEVASLAQRLLSALVSRFNIEATAGGAPHPLHITIGLSSTAAGDACAGLRSTTPRLRLGDRVEVLVSACVVDPCALVLVVSALRVPGVDGRASVEVTGLSAGNVDDDDGSPAPLHITLGHVSQVRAVYSLELLRRAAAAAEGAVAAAPVGDDCRRKRRVTANFLHLALAAPLVLHGIIACEQIP